MPCCSTSVLCTRLRGLRSLGLLLPARKTHRRADYQPGEGLHTHTQAMVPLDDVNRVVRPAPPIRVKWLKASASFGARLRSQHEHCAGRAPRARLQHSTATLDCLDVLLRPTACTHLNHWGFLTPPVDGAALGRTCGLPWRRAACGGPAIKAVSAASRRLQMWMRVTVYVLYVCRRAACMVHTWMRIYTHEHAHAHAHTHLPSHAHHSPPNTPSECAEDPCELHPPASNRDHHTTHTRKKESMHARCRQPPSPCPHRRAPCRRWTCAQSVWCAP